MLEAKILVKKLNPYCKRALEKSAALCVSKTHHVVELLHYLHVLFEAPSSSILAIFKHFNVDREALLHQLSQGMGTLKTGNGATPALSELILTLMQEGWVQSSIILDRSAICASGYLLALLHSPVLRLEVERNCPNLLALTVDEVRTFLLSIMATGGFSDEEEGGGASREGSAARTSPTPYLSQYCQDLTALAAEGKIDPITGRETEIHQLVDILIRRRQNNPILTGEPGVGKTAVVEGLALKIAQGDVPALLKNARIKALDLGLLEAGAGVKGEFENRLKGLIGEIQKSPEPIILFIDEAHTLIGAGAQAGQGDAANLLKPALARGDLRTIAATTWVEYKKYFEKDAALARRFQVVKINEPDEANAISMLRGLVLKLEYHHRVRIRDEAIVAAVRLSHRYMTGRRLPDKAIGVLDTACARVHIARSSLSHDITHGKAQMERLKLEEQVLSRECLVEGRHEERLAVIDRELKTLSITLKEKEHAWTFQKKLVDLLDQMYGLLAKGEQDPDVLTALKIKEREFSKIASAAQVIPLDVDAQIVAQVIADWTGIPVGKMMRDELNALLNLKKSISAAIYGQDQALEIITRHLKTYHAHLDTPDKPIGVFLLAGPSGVGKTETAYALSEAMTGSVRNLITINMSEYQEAHAVATLRGSPPGYVGYGKGGVLTESVRQNPFSVVLLDEIEKAHTDVLEVFYQVFDKGVMEDGEGIEIDFKNAILILTTNVGDQLIQSLNGQPFADVRGKLYKELSKRFPPAFLARLTIVPYFSLAFDDLKQIARLKMLKIQMRFEQAYHVSLTYEEGVIPFLIGEHSHNDVGARAIDHSLAQELLPALSDAVLTRLAEGQPFSSVDISLGQDHHLQYIFS